MVFVASTADVVTDIDKAKVTADITSRGGTVVDGCEEEVSITFSYS